MGELKGPVYINFHDGLTLGQLEDLIRQAKQVGAEDSWKVICGGMQKSRPALSVHLIPAAKVFSVDYVEGDHRTLELTGIMQKGQTFNVDYAVAERRAFENVSGGFAKFIQAAADHMAGRCICKGGLCSDYCPWAMWKVFGQADPSWMGEEVNAPAPQPPDASEVKL